MRGCIILIKRQKGEVVEKENDYSIGWIGDYDLFTFIGSLADLLES